MNINLKIIACAVFSCFLITGLSAQVVPDDMKISKKEVPLWVYELFVNNNVEFAKLNLKVEEDSQIFYGAYKGKNLQYSKMMAESNARSALSKKLCEQVGGNIHPTNVSNMELIKETSVDFYSDNGDYEVQVFCVYKMTANAWKKAVADAQKWESDKSKIKDDFEEGLHSFSDALNDAGESIKKGVDDMSNEIQKGTQKKEKTDSKSTPQTAI